MLTDRILDWVIAGVLTLAVFLSWTAAGWGYAASKWDSYSSGDFSSSGIVVPVFELGGAILGTVLVIVALVSWGRYIGPAALFVPLAIGGFGVRCGLKISAPRLDQKTTVQPRTLDDTVAGVMQVDRYLALVALICVLPVIVFYAVRLIRIRLRLAGEGVIEAAELGQKGSTTLRVRFSAADGTVHHIEKPNIHKLPSAFYPEVIVRYIGEDPDNGRRCMLFWPDVEPASEQAS